MQVFLDDVVQQVDACVHYGSNRPQKFDCDVKQERVLEIVAAQLGNEPASVDSFPVIPTIA